MRVLYWIPPCVLLIAAVLLSPTAQGAAPQALGSPSSPQATQSVAPATSSVAPATSSVAQRLAPAAGANLLVHGDFEASSRYSQRSDPYDPYGPEQGPLTVADGWYLWYNNVQECPTLTAEAAAWQAARGDVQAECDRVSYNRRPEYQPEPYSNRVHSGSTAQKMFTFSGTHEAGLYQVVTGVAAGRWVRFAIWVQTWSSDLDYSAYSVNPGFYATSVGIDPYGGSQWSSPNIVWSKPYVSGDRWVLQEISVQAKSDTVSVWVRGTQNFPVKHNDSYWDDASLEIIGGAPTPTPTDTPTLTPPPTPAATPTGYAPPPARVWSRVWQATADGSRGARWRVDPGAATYEQYPDGLFLRNVREGTPPAPINVGAFGLAWVQGHWPTSGDLRLSFRFRFQNVTAYGTGIQVGSWPYWEQRVVLGVTDMPHMGEVLEIEHSNPASGFRILLLGKEVWRGTAGDDSEYNVELTLHGVSYTLRLYNETLTKTFTAVSYLRPRSLVMGNPAVLSADYGAWTEVGIAGVQLATRDPLVLPLVRRGPR